MKRFFVWVLVNGLFSFILYLGTYKEIQGFLNVSILWTWFLFFVSFGALSSDVQKTLKKRGRSVPQAIDAMFDVTIISVFAFYGCWLTAIAYNIHFIIMLGVWDKIEKEKSNEPNT